MKLRITVAALMLAMPAFACHVVDSGHILGSDFASAIPAFAALDPAVQIGAAPLPGVARTFRPEEITRIAHANKITLASPAVEICFVRQTEPLTEEKLLPALRAALNVDDAKIEVLDFPRIGVPRGALTFSRNGISGAIWRGHVSYDNSRSFAIWAKVRITAERTWIETANAVGNGQLIEAAHLVARSGPRFPLGPQPLASIDEATARKSLRSIRAGEAVFASMLIAPCAVERGDTVHVAVSSGGASLEFDALAESSARIGETVLIKNPETSRFFRARVEEKGKVSVTK